MILIRAVNLEQDNLSAFLVDAMSLRTLAGGCAVWAPSKGEAQNDLPLWPAMMVNSPFPGQCANIRRFGDDAAEEITVVYRDRLCSFSLIEGKTHQLNLQVKCVCVSMSSSPSSPFHLACVCVCRSSPPSCPLFLVWPRVRVCVSSHLL